jgi:hypothetical protein
MVMPPPRLMASERARLMAATKLLAWLVSVMLRNIALKEGTPNVSRIEMSATVTISSMRLKPERKNILFRSDFVGEARSHIHVPSSQMRRSSAV